MSPACRAPTGALGIVQRKWFTRAERGEKPVLVARAQQSPGTVPSAKVSGGRDSDRHGGRRHDKPGGRAPTRPAADHRPDARTLIRVPLDLRVGDVVLSVGNGKPDSAESLRRLLRDALAIGDATLTLKRGDKTETVKVSLPD